MTTENTPMPAPTAPQGGSEAARKRTGLGRLAQLVGILGIVACLVLLAGTWYGRGVVAGHVDGFAGDLVTAIGKVTNATDTLATLLDTRAADVTAIADEARSIASDPTATSEIVDAISARLGDVGNRYADLRSKVVEIREKASAAIEMVKKVDQLIPFIDIPQGPLDLVEKVDTGLTTLDAAVSGVLSKADAASGVQQAATELAADADAIAAGLTNGAEAVRSLGSGIGGFSTEVTNVSASIGSLLTLVAAAFTILFGWLLILHLALRSLGRRMARG